MKLSDLPVRKVLNINMAAPLKDEPLRHPATTERRREQRRQAVKRFRLNNRERWNEIQRNSRRRRAEA